MSCSVIVVIFIQFRQLSLFITEKHVVYYSVMYVGPYHNYHRFPMLFLQTEQTPKGVGGGIIEDPSHGSGLL